MNRYFLITLLTLLTYSCNTMNQNPLLRSSEAPYGAPEFDKIENQHYIPAFEQAIKEAREEVEQIAQSKEEPTFENTIYALEKSGELLSKVSNIFFNLNQSNTSEEMEQIAMEVTAPITQFDNDVALNLELFQRVKAVYDKREELDLNLEQKTLLDKTYKGFTRGGALLEDQQKERYRQVTEELSSISLQFSQNSLAATNDFILNITDSTELAGLPNFAKNGAKEEAASRGLEGWVFTLQAPSYIPFMQYSENRELRHKLWHGYNSKCIDGKYDNRDIVKRIVNLRLEKANLLGFATHADYVLTERMAKDTKIVDDFLSELLTATKEYADSDVAMVAEFAKKEGLKGELQPWDFGYYSEKLKQQRYSLDDEQLKPYFSLDNAVGGIFTLADRLYGLKFTQDTTIPLYHQDVTAYKVEDASGRYIGLLYLDFFPRASKRSGAWMTSFREQSIDSDGEHRPFVSVVCNFTKPTDTTPSLLTFDEVTTLLHEFGHALHGLLAEGSYSSITGTNVAWDFVELPSQIMENWATEKDFLELWAKHYKSGEVIPEALINKVVASRNYLSGYANVRQLTFGINDMAWHTITEPFDGDVIAFEKESIKDCLLLPDDNTTAISPSMGHIFPGGYSAGYYSYKWAEVLEADAFSMFVNGGIFSKDVASSFRENVLSKGAIGDAMDNYVAFRGSKPTVEALLVKLGLKN